MGNIPILNPQKVSSILITHLGGETCVTGSCHLVRFHPDHGSPVAILVDCGIAQGHDPQVSFDRFPVPPADIDFLCLTHAHIDHIGRVPDLIDAGFCGEIICTHCTKALLLPMLRDAMSFSDRTDSQVRAMEKQINDLSWGFELYESFTLKHNIAFTLKNADHILGSCFIQFSFPNPDGSAYRVTFSGDLGCRHTPILPDPDPPDACDLLILESTYGDHPIRFNHLYAVEKFQDHQRLLQLTGPAVIIAGSGMCTGGRIVNHLKHSLNDPKNDLFFVGYQAKGTPGRDIVKGRTSAKAAIHRLSGYSAHVDQQTLCDWVKSMPEPPGEIRLVHGEPEAQRTLKSKLDILF